MKLCWDPACLRGREPAAAAAVAAGNAIPTDGVCLLAVQWVLVMPGKQDAR
jgi:hypothetical protein